MTSRSPAGWADKIAAAAETNPLVTFAFFLVVALVWFFTLPHGILMGDDLNLIYATQHGGLNPISSLWLEGASKYRPVSNFLFAVSALLFGHTFRAYVLLNVVVEAASATVLASIAWRLSGRKVWVAGCAGVAFIIARFSYYAVDQVTGLFEAVALLLALLVVSDVIAAYRLNDLGRARRTLLWFALAIFDDERFIVLAPFIVLASLLHPSARKNRRDAALISVGTVAISGLNYAIKAFVFRTNFFTGTGGEDLKPDQSSIARFLFDGLLNVLGFNVGPAYLSGADVSQVGTLGYLLGWVTAGAVVAVFALWAWRRARDGAGLLARDVVLGGALFVPLLLSASVAFRQEFRWLYVAYAVVLVGLAAAAGAYRDRPRAVSAVAGGLLCVTAISSLVYRSYLGNVFFMYSMKIAQTVKSTMDAHPGRPAIIVTNGDPSIQGWIFLDHRFFDEYGLEHVPLAFVPSADRIAAVPWSRGAEVFEVQGTDILDVTGRPGLVGDAKAAKSRNTAAAAAAAPLAALPAANRTYPFLARFSDGTINSHQVADTPSKTGAFVMSWPSPRGALPSLTILASFRYAFPHVPLDAASELSFYVTRPYVGAPTRAFVDVADGTKSDRVFQEDLPAPGP
ncbi:MAG: hypothetical protein ABI186_09295, partial [Candidatus Elarobacter sp.]